jgi:glycosyltransferase involved in cell wall biosynthesis
VIALDLSRLLSRARFATPTGIDRVELAYARYLLGGDRPHCFAARNATGGIGLLPRTLAAEFAAALAGMWRDGGSPRETARLARRLRLAALVGEAGLRRELRGDGSPAYLLVSHHKLDRPRPVERLKAACGARFICLIHDLIPLEHPDLVRPGQERRHARRIAAVAAIADAVIANSAATRDSLRRWLGPAASSIPLEVAPLGIDLPDTIAPETIRPDAIAPDAGTHPYFVCIGTIEARKNHLLLLELWQLLAADLGDRTPRLMLVGRRAFGGDAIGAGIAASGGTVTDHAEMPDARMTALLRGARALLLPSFAEGFGLPVVEALAHGVPVLCSDLPALRESGGGVPDYLDPADADAWRRAIVDYLAESPRRRDQLARIAAWRPPRWGEHFAAVERLLAVLG